MADEEKRERRDSASSDSSVEKDDDKSISFKDELGVEKSSSDKDELDERSVSELEGEDQDKSSSTSEEPPKTETELKDASLSGSRRSSDSSNSSNLDNHLDDVRSQTTDDNTPHETPNHVNYEDLQHGSLDSFGMSHVADHVYANASFEPESPPDNGTSGPDSPSTRRASMSSMNVYEQPNPPDIAFYNIPLQGTESERPSSSATVIVNDDESESPFITYMYGAIVFALLFIIILILYFSITLV